MNTRTLRKISRDVRHRFLKQPWFEVEPRDCIRASWPRSGNTWLRHAIYYYMYKTAVANMQQLERSIPILDGLDFKKHLAAAAGASHRFVKSHEIAADYLFAGRIVYVVRDGRDATLSYFKLRQELYGETANFDLFLKRCLHDKLRYRAWHSNVSTWLDYASCEKLLIVRYEDILDDPHKNLTMILDHFGIPIDEERMVSALEKSSVKNVNKTFQSMNQAKSGGFKGGSGGGKMKWKTQYTPAQLDLFHAKSGGVLNALGYPV